MGDLVNSKNLCNPDLSDPEKKICDSKKNLDTPPLPCLDSPRILDLGDINFLESQNLCRPNLGSGGVSNLRGHPIGFHTSGTTIRAIIIESSKSEYRNIRLSDIRISAQFLCYRK